MPMLAPAARSMSSRRSGAEQRVIQPLDERTCSSPSPSNVCTAHEFVAAETRDEFAGRRRSSRSRSATAQQRQVAGGMAPDVVDLLEAVEVDAEDRDLRPAGGGAIAAGGRDRR